MPNRPIEILLIYANISRRSTETSTKTVCTCQATRGFTIVSQQTKVSITVGRDWSIVMIVPVLEGSGGVELLVQMELVYV